MLEQALFKTDNHALLLLLEASANPNVLRKDGTPVWWQALEVWNPEDIRRTERMRILLDHGADVKIRHGQYGAMSLALMNQAYDQALMLIERGAEWKQERLSRDNELASDVVFEAYAHAEQRLSMSDMKILEALLKLKKMYEDLK